MKRIRSKKSKYILICVLAVLVFVFLGVTINQHKLKKWNPNQVLIGTWVGSGETREFGQLENIEVVIHIDEAGVITGTVGDSLIEECVINLNRNSFEKFIHVKTDYIIQDGYLNGSIGEGDELTYRDISVPFNIEDGIMGGTLFHVEDWKYPYPVLLHLELKKTIT